MIVYIIKANVWSVAHQSTHTTGRLPCCKEHADADQTMQQSGTASYEQRW